MAAGRLTSKSFADFSRAAVYDIKSDDLHISLISPIEKGVVNADFSYFMFYFAKSKKLYKFSFDDLTTKKIVKSLRKMPIRRGHNTYNDRSEEEFEYINEFNNPELEWLDCRMTKDKSTATDTILASVKYDGIASINDIIELISKSQYKYAIDIYYDLFIKSFDPDNEIDWISEENNRNDQLSFEIFEGIKNKDKGKTPALLPSFVKEVLLTYYH